MINLDDLEAKAKDATQGRWTTGPYGSVVCADSGDESTHNGDDTVRAYGGYLVAESFRPKNSDYVAAMNPTTALALIDVARAAQEAIENTPFIWKYDHYDSLKNALRGIE